MCVPGKRWEIRTPADRWRYTQLGSQTHVKLNANRERGRGHRRDGRQQLWNGWNILEFRKREILEIVNEENQNQA